MGKTFGITIDLPSGRFISLYKLYTIIYNKRVCHPAGAAHPIK